MAKEEGGGSQIERHNSTETPGSRNRTSTRGSDTSERTTGVMIEAADAFWVSCPSLGEALMSSTSSPSDILQVEENRISQFSTPPTAPMSHL
jgi:hypothetical protein